MEALLSYIAALGWGAIVAIGVVLVILVIIFIVILRQALRSSRK
jgi:hypothetical protein